VLPFEGTVKLVSPNRCISDRRFPKKDALMRGVYERFLWRMIDYFGIEECR
jgi:hypothetical protein